MKVEIYSKDNCSFCTKAKTLLNIRGIKYVEYDIMNPTFKIELLDKVKDVRTVPQIFIDDKHIGGFKELEAYLN